ncbi:hypothetical protein QL285_068056 [Trifolium repens]|nr:hypothetical protein QL285_068056 [Trifolium repens]
MFHKGEVIAILEAMKEMEHRGFTHIIFETDSKNVVDAIHKRRGGNSECSSLICNIKNVVFLNLNFVVKFVKRQVKWLLTRLLAAIFWLSRYVIELLPCCISFFVSSSFVWQNQ